MKGKKFLAFALTVAMMAGGALSVSAAGVSDVFSGDYYAGKYADIKAGVGTDTAALLKHAVTFGIKEGRVVSPILDVAAYRKAYADLDAAFGDNWDAYVDHYLNYGIKEKRTSGVLFDLVDYANKNADIKAAYGDDYAAIAQHYVTYGIKEGRPGGAIVKATPKPAASTPSSSSSASSSSASSTTPPATTPAPSYPQVDSTLKQHVHSHADYDWATFFNDWKLSNGTLAVPNWVTGVKRPTCTEDGYVEWRCTEPVYWDQVDTAGNITGVILVGTCDKMQHVVWPKSHKILQRVNAGGLNVTDSLNAFLLAPTCQKEGTAIYTCTACGLQQTETLPKVAHIYNVTIVDPTGCGHDFSHPERLVGYYKFDCIYGCGSSFTKFRDETWKQERVVLNAAGTVGLLEHVKGVTSPDQPEHQVATYDNVKVLPTCLTPGSASGYCAKCGEEETKAIAPLDHAFTQTDDRYVDSYTRKTIADRGWADGDRCHTKVTLTFCERCDLISNVTPAAVTSADAEKCTDLDNNGWCDKCNHPMDRQFTEQVMEYHKGDILHNVVGQ